MNAFTLGLLALLSAQSADPLRPAGSDRDVKITTRRTSGGRPGSTVITEIVYVKGARHRVDTIVERPSRSDAGISADVTIMQCDEQRTVFLNTRAKTYATLPPLEGSGRVVRPRFAPGLSRSPDPTTPVTTITVDAVDTGERRPLGSFMAHRVITTTETRTDAASGDDVDLVQEDGWYVDLSGTGCPVARRDEGRVVAAVSGALPRVEVVSHGTARRGYPIQEVRRSRRGAEAGMVTKTIELVEFSDAALDASLFTVPAGYRPALPRFGGGYDLSKPDTVRNRIQALWEQLNVWTTYFLR